MDDETNTQIHKLAQSLKSLHLAATSEEAYARAKEIILSSQTSEKPLAAMMGTLNSEETMKPAKNAERNEKEQIKDATSELDELECATRDAKELVEQAKRAQKKK